MTALGTPSDGSRGTRERPDPRLVARGATLGYESRAVVSRLDLEIPTGAFTAIVGPNASGKSTLLRGVARLLRPTEGAVLLDGRSLATWRPKEFARQVGLLPQTAVAPDGITVADLVARGRHPHRSLLGRWTARDDEVVAEALASTGITDLAERRMQELSGGQRQRAWAAMALAQEPSILLLDEPTTFLDLAHQYELLELFASLGRERGTTVVAVLHDLAHAARYAGHVVALRGGAVVAQGAPHEVITEATVEAVFGLPCVVVDDPVTGTPLVVPRMPGAASSTPSAPDSPPSAPASPTTAH